jgi:hemerythrin-like domain-containing protein
MKHPIDELMQDHRLIERVLDAIEAADSPQPLAFYEKVLDFITHYADEHHHDKEEGKLFPALIDQGMPSAGGPIGCMLVEHQDARMHTQRIREAVAEGNTEAAARAGGDYVALLRAHIAKEDNILYKMALEILSSEAFDQMARDFESVESRAPCRDRYQKLADEIASSAR